MDEGSSHIIGKRNTTPKDDIPSEEAIAADGTKGFTSAAAEYQWLSQNYPNFRIIRQTFTYNIELDKDYDTFTIMTSNGALRIISFEISF